MDKRSSGQDFSGTPNSVRTMKRICETQKPEEILPEQKEHDRDIYMRLLSSPEHKIKNRHGRAEDASVV